MPRRWRIASHDPDLVARLQRDMGVPSVVAHLLCCRGIADGPAAHRFLEAKLSGLYDPADLPGATQAAERLAQAISAGRRIVVYGDYDADGMTATAILLLCLQLLGANVTYYVPNRLDEGYGLNDDALRSLAAQGAQMVVTVDCGIASVKEAITARELGLELIVTDHHEMAASLPEAAAVVHPRLPGSSYPFGHLAGAGVAFKLAWALCQQVGGASRVSPRMRNFLMQAVGLAALGTIADVVPLLDENRILVRHGLVSLHQNPTPGLAALMEITSLSKKPHLVAEDVGFTIAPRLNAAGRLGQAQLGVELLTTASQDRAVALAEYLHELNGSRDSLERSIYLAANRQAQEYFDAGHEGGLVLAERGWHPGVIGIVAGRLAEKYHRPVVLVALDSVGVKPGVGSCRSAAGFNLHEALQTCSEHLLGHGGHAAAAGLTIDEGCLDAFRVEFSALAGEAMLASGQLDDLEVDCETAFSGLTAPIVRQIETLGPFGRGNLRPVLCTTGVTLVGPPKRMGGGERHLSVTLAQSGIKFRAVAFGNGDWADELSQVAAPLSVAFKPVLNNFRGRSSVELHLADWNTDQANGNAKSDGAPLSTAVRR
jgi:single-stranded-DNA-specific exonuclease